ncbi:MAG: hypothetical protein PSV13_07005 [Lacunisphaera sp.]|nr:hypothetical protein [Lacunisphaera sp.]
MPPHPQKGSVSLVALCCVAVLGIALASFLAVSSQSMKLSNRGYAKDVSRQLAEMGLERALRGFSFDVFSGGWTPSGNTAKRTLSISSSNYGTSGITATVNIRVDNYRTTNKAVGWSAFTNYAVNDYVWYQGVWYLCISAPPAKQNPSNTTYWTAAPAPWTASANYRIGNIAISGGNAYRCTADNFNKLPPNGSYWTSYAASTWSSATTYSVNDVAFAGGTAYRCIAASTNNSPPNTTYWLSSPVIYSEGVATLPDSSSAPIKTQLRAYIAPAALFPNAIAATTLVTLSSTGTVDSYNSPLATWSSTQPYSPGDVVRLGASGTTYYRCTTANTNQTPPSASWTTTLPLGYSAVIAGGSTSSTAVSVVSAVIGGYVAAPSSTISPYASNAYSGFSPGATTPSLTNSDGSVTSPHASAAKVDLTRISRSPYIPQFDIQTISTGTNLPASRGNGTRLFQGPLSLGTAGATTPTIYNITYTYDTGSTTGISTSGSPGTPYPGLDLYEPNHDLTIVGPVILNVTGLFNIYQGSITIASGGSLEIYFTGALDIGYPTAVASAGIDNTTNDPTKMIIVGTSTANTVNSHYVRTRRPFCGLIYMPSAFLTMTNSGPNDLYGAFSAKNINFQNTVNFHYDTALRSAGAIGTFIDAPYVITEWRELTDPNERAVLP